MNTLQLETELAEKYKYKPLKDDLSSYYRNMYIENIPTFLEIDGDTKALFTLNGTQICKKYDRIVVGDYGAFIEISYEDIVTDLEIKKGQEYRINDERYSKNIKYVWLTINDNSDIKIYLQQRTVSYADYKPDKFYISVHEVCEERQDKVNTNGMQL